MQNETMKYHYKSIRMAQIQNTDDTSAGKNVGQQELSFISGWKAKWYSHLEGSLAVFYKTKHTLTI